MVINVLLRSPAGILVSVIVPRLTLVPLALVLTGTWMGDDARLKAMPLAGTTGVTLMLVVAEATPSLSVTAIV
jgi:hypothetical protein